MHLWVERGRLGGRRSWRLLRTGATIARMSGARPTKGPGGAEPPAESESEDLDLGGDELSDEERAELHAAIRRGLEDAKAGRCIPAEEFLAELRARR